MFGGTLSPTERNVGINNLEKAREEESAFVLVLKKNPNPKCFFCATDIQDDFVYWDGVDGQTVYLHTECSCELGQHLIKDGMNARYRKPQLDLSDDVPERYVPGRWTDQDNVGISVSGSGGRLEQIGRAKRLSDVISYAAGMASVKRHVDVGVFLANLLAVHDHKGCLSVLWANQAAAISFGTLMVDAWVFVNEVDDMVDHYINTEPGPTPLFYGRDPRNRKDDRYGWDFPFGPSPFETVPS
jgi:hypothetical protein